VGPKQKARAKWSTYSTGDPVLLDTEEVSILFIKVHVRELGLLQQFRIEPPL
jgi:hypothetical protein